MSVKRTVILFPAAFLMNVNLLMINFSVIFFFKDIVGLSASTIGWFFAVGFCGYGLGCLMLRPLQNKIIPPVSMFIGLFMAAASLIMIKGTTSPALVLVFYLIFSTSPAFFWPQMMGWFSFGLSNAQLGKSISKFNISWSSGAVLGPLLGGIIAERNVIFSFYIDLAVIGLIGLLLLLGLIFIKDMRNYPSHSSIDTIEPEAKGELLNEGRGTILRFGGWIGVYSIYVVLGLLNNIFPLFIRETLGLGESVAGNLLFVRGITTAIGFYLTGRFIQWHFNRKIMLITQASVIVILVILFFNKSIPGFYILFIFYGLLFSIAYANGIFHGSAGANERGRRMALFESILTLGIITGSIGGGYLFQYYSINKAFIFSAAIIGLGLIAQIVIIAVGRRKRLD